MIPIRVEDSSNNYLIIFNGSISVHPEQFDWLTTGLSKDDKCLPKRITRPPTRLRATGLF
jgi:hypothetical protein